MRLEVPAKYIYLLELYGVLSYPVKIRSPENLQSSFFNGSWGENMYDEVSKYLSNDNFSGLLDLGLDVENIYDIIPGMYLVTIDYDVSVSNYKKLCQNLKNNNIKLIYDLPIDFN